MKYSERLKAARDARDMTQTQLSEASGVSQSLISQLENSETAKGSRYSGKLATAMGCSLLWLIDEEGPMFVYPQASSPLKANESTPRGRKLSELCQIAEGLDVEDLSELIGLARYLKSKATSKANLVA